MLLAGWPVEVPGVTINRNCASGIDSVVSAALRIRSGEADIVVAGGAAHTLTGSIPMCVAGGGLESMWIGANDPAPGPVFADDDFATIVRAVREGRRIHDNVRKFVAYTMTSNTGELLTLLLAPVFGLPLPLLPLQILWINLVTDGLTAVALGVEPGEAGIMRRPPRRPGADPCRSWRCRRRP